MVVLWYDKVMKITKAIIPVAGWGTRRLPVTKSIEKCMLPICNRPIVDYVVEDCFEAGITDIYFVVSEGSTQLQDYYSINQDLEDYLVDKGKTDMLPLVTPPTMNFHYIEQDPTGKYGTAIPTAMIFKYLQAGESVVVLMGDDFTFEPSHAQSDVARLIAQAERNGGSAMLGATIDAQKVSRYGVLEFDQQRNFVQIVEKPAVEDAPSNMINISKYVLDYRAMTLIHDYAQREDVMGEYYITIPLNDYVQGGGKIKVVPAVGEYLDGGTLEGWIHANQVVFKSLNGK